jgi:hypothetical protein
MEAALGADLVRAGLDLTVGLIGRGELLVRESVTGHRYCVIRNEGLSEFFFVLGRDVADVTQSIYLPDEDGFEVTPNRDREQAFLHWQGAQGVAF